MTPEETRAAQLRALVEATANRDENEIDLRVPWNMSAAADRFRNEFWRGFAQDLARGGK